jgi:hypothetical protein
MIPATGSISQGSSITPTDPELLDENDLAALGVERQHRHSMAALEHFADEFGAHAAGEEPVTQAVADDLEMAVVRDGLRKDRDPRIRHVGSRRCDLR